MKKIRLGGEGNGNPLQYFCLGNPMNRGAWRATVHGVAKSQTRLDGKVAAAAAAFRTGHGLNRETEMLI